MAAINEIFKPYQKEGRSTMILTGRSIYDLDCRDDASISSSLVKLMAEYAKNLNMAFVRYSKAKGLFVPYSMYEKADAETIKKVLNNNGISNGACNSGNCKASQELVNILSGISRMSSSSNTEYLWKNGQPMKFLFLLEFSSHIMPNSSTDNQDVANELIYGINHSSTFRNSGHLLILSDVEEGKINSQIQSLLYHNFLPYPDSEEKLKFIKGLHSLYPNVQYAPNVDDHLIANLTSGTPNQSLEQLFYASQHHGLLIEERGLVEQKMKDVQDISEGTITMLDTSRVKNITLAGENTRNALSFVNELASGLRAGNKSTPLNILLMGAPGTAKTVMAISVALKAGVPGFQLNSPKAGIVGETERRAALQARIFSSTTPSLGFIDEITEAMPMQRTQNLDSGASDAVMQSLLNMLSDNSREGRSMIVATTNCGFKMGAAMRDRFVIVPVIMPSLEDFPAIICSLAQQVSETTLDEHDHEIQAAAKIFYAKHLMPRRMRAAMQLTCQGGRLTSREILEAAKDANPLDEASWLSAVYADLCAISLTVSKRLLPWYGREDTYPFPEYIRNILDENHEVDSVKLNNEINRLQPYVNV